MKFFTRLFLPVFVAYVVLLPGLAEATVIPFPTAAALDVVEAGAEVAVGTASAPVSAILLGAVALYLAFRDGQGNKAQIPIGQAVPTPSAASSATATTVYPYIVSGTSYTSEGAACNALIAAAAANSAYGTISGGSCNDLASGGTVSVGVGYVSLKYTFTSSVYGSTGLNATQGAAVTACPSGYVASGSSCTLSNPYLVASNSSYANADIVRNGQSFSNPTGDVTQTPQGLKPIIGQTTTANDTVTINGTNADNHQQQTQIIALPNGATQVNQYTQQPDANGNTYMNVSQTTFDSSGAVTQNSNAATQQQFSADPSTGAVTITGSNIAANPAPATGTITFPNDYARTGEAATAAQSIIANENAGPPSDGNLGNEQQALSANANSQSTALQNIGNLGQSNENGLLNYALPQPVAQDNTCTDPTFTIGASGFSHTVTFTGFCSSLMKVRELLQWVLYVFTLSYLFFLVTSRREA